MQGNYKFKDKIIEFKFDVGTLLFNPYTLKKMLKHSDKISDSDLDVLKKSEFTLEKPEVKKYRVEITFQCNCACDYCLVYKNKVLQIGERMGLETAKKIVEDFNKNVPGGSFMIIGGEPLLNKEVLNYFLDNVNGKISIFTNAILVDKDYAERLAKSNVRVFVSLDGWEELNFHRKDLGGKPCYKKTLEGYKLLRKAGAKTAITCLATRDNQQHLYDIVKYFHTAFGETNFGISIPHYTKESNFSVDIKEYTSQMIKIFDYAKKNSIYVDQIAKRLLAIVTNKPRYYSCKIAGEQVTFYPLGEKTLCTKLDTLLGFKGKPAEFYEQQLPYNSLDCLKCAAIGICGGGCFWDALFNNSKRDVRDCYFNKKILYKILEDISINSPKNKILSEGDLIKSYAGMLGKLIQ